MADGPLDPDNGNDTRLGPTDDQPPGMPRWVKVSGMIVVALILAMGVIFLVSGGEHGPGRHMPRGHTPGALSPRGGHG